MTHATIDSSVYRATFYGILNAEGEFWTPLAFDSDRKAAAHLDAFWAPNKEKQEQCRRTHKIVPVRIQLTALEALPA